MPSDSSRRSAKARPPFSSRGLLLLIVLGAIVLRTWGLDFGLPQRFHPDEPVVVTRAQYGVAANDWNPRAFHWPSLQIYILGAEYEVWYWVGRITGSWENADEDFIAYALRAPAGFYYLGRLTTVLFGAGCVWLTFLLAARFLGTAGAMTAGAMVALNPIMARHSRYVTPDIPAEFFFLASLFYMDRLVSAVSVTRDTASSKGLPNTARLGIIAAILIGLGAGTKYPVGLLALPLLAVVLLSPGAGIVRRVVSALGIAATMLLVFIITTPFALLDWREFVSDVATIQWHVRTGHIGMEAAGGIWLASLRQLLRDSGWIWTAAGAIGAAALLLRNPRRTWPIIISLVVVLLGLAPLNVFSDRYLVPLVPFLALGLGWWVDWLPASIRKAPWAAESETRRRAPITLAVCAVLATGIPGVLILLGDAHRLTLPDTREGALAWVEENIPPHTVVIKEQGGPDLNSSEMVPLVPEPWYFVTEITPLFFRGGTHHDPLDTMLTTLPDWVITSSQVRDRYMREGAEEEFPGIVAAFREYYRLIDDYLIEEARFSPGKGVAGPEVVIYRVPRDLWERIKVEEATVEEVLERERDESAE